MTLRSLSHFKLPLAFLLALSIAGCANWDELGAEKKTPLPGQRKALFPEGIPGVEFGAPPTQPGNSNIAINRNSPQQQSTDEVQAQQQSGERQEQPRERAGTQPKQKQPARTAARKKSTDEEDPWMETR
jgi:hypothetical protein